MGLHPQLDAERRPLAVVGELALHLLEPLSGSLVIVENGVVPGQLVEVADVAEGRLGIEDQALVADLLVMGQAPCLLPRAGDAAHPSLGDPVDRMFLGRAVADRKARRLGRL